MIYTAQRIELSKAAGALIPEGPSPYWRKSGCRVQ